MKKFFLPLIATMVATISFAQSQTATVLRGDEIKTYFGLSSLVSAMTEAMDGDIITLSQGQFKASQITKAVTLRGAGMVETTDALVDYLPTVIDGDFTLQLDENTNGKLTIEGIKFTGSVNFDGVLLNPTFINCNFNIFRYKNTTSKIQDANFIHCRVGNNLTIYDNSTVTCINSIVRRPSSYQYSENSTFEFVNCVLTHVIPHYHTGIYSGSGTNWYLTYSSFKNCYIYVDTNYEYYMPFNSNTLVTNCVSNYSAMFTNIANNTNKIIAPSVVFDSYTGGTWNDGQKFYLRDEAKTSYLGDDGTQIGIYGGNIPYEERISMPRITKCNVAGRTTVDGKLSVDIQVEAAQ